MNFYDIKLDDYFIRDYDLAPKEIKDRADRKIKRWSRSGLLTKGDHLHKANGNHDCYITYLGTGLGGWRILLTCEDGILNLQRLVNHAEMDRLLA